MSRQKHIIHRQVYKLSASTHAEAARLQLDMSRLHRNSLEEMVAEALDELGSENDYLLLDRLEIDLGTLESGSWEKQIGIRIKEALKEKIQATPLAAKKEFATSGDSEKKAAIHFVDEEEKKQELLFYFLRKGRLPWWWPAGEKANMRDLWLTLAKSRSLAGRSRLRKLMANATVAKRIIAHVPSRKLPEVLLFALEGENSAVAALEYTDRLFHFLSKRSQTKQQEMSLQFCLDLLSGSSRSKRDTGETIAAPASIEARLKNPYFAETIRDVLQKLQIDLDKKQLEQFQKLEQQQSKDNWNFQPETLKLLLDRKAKGAFKAEKGTVKEEKTKQDKVREQRKGPPYFIEEEEDAIVVGNAGMVLLYPYLKQFFHEHELLDEGQQFRDEESQAKAMHLLHYLCSGANAAAEFELTFNKIMCGWPLEEPVEMNFKITKTIEDSVNDLLRSAVKNWSALKSTSPEGLRQAFLVREGLLYLGERTLIRIERQTHDILMDRLPFALSMFRLPWLSDMIYVEW